MRKIVMPNKARRTDLAKSRMNEKESVSRRSGRASWGTRYAKEK